MKSLINLVTSNLITVISIAVVVISLGFLGFVHITGNAVQENIAQRSTMLKQINMLRRQRVEVPSSSPDKKVEVIRTTINPKVIAELKQINKRMDEERQGIFEFAMDRNRRDHLILVDDLFPTPGTVSAPILARERYEDVFSLMLLPAPEPGEELSAGDASLPYLDAGMPPTQEQIDKELQDIADEIIASEAIHGTVNLTGQQQEDLRNLQAEHISAMLQERAARIHIYAQTDWQSPDFPFDVAKWSDTRPQPHEMWEGQLEQWIQQDIARALALTNDAANPKSNVLTAPVKRLLRIQIVPGYIGFHTYGEVEKMASEHRGSGPAGRMIARYGAPAGGMTVSADKAQSDNFFVGPTGRTSNALYDVRQARLVAVVDFQQMPKLFDAISSVNFMTVVGCRISDVDEYEALAEGYLYGPGDAVQVELLIETIWLRNWTEQLMPDAVKQYVGLLEPDEEDVNEWHQYMPIGPAGMMPGGFDYYRQP